MPAAQEPAYGVLRLAHDLPDLTRGLSSDVLRLVRDLSGRVLRLFRYPAYRASFALLVAVLFLAILLAAGNTANGVLYSLRDPTCLIRDLPRSVLDLLGSLTGCVLRLVHHLLWLLLAALLLVLYFAHRSLLFGLVFRSSRTLSSCTSSASPVTPLAGSAGSIEAIDGEDSIDGMDSIEAVESSLRPGRGRGSTPPLSILLITSSALRSAAFCRASMPPRTNLSAARIRPSILRSACFWRRS